MDSKLETMGSKLGRMEEQIQDITVKVVRSHLHNYLLTVFR